MKKSIFSVVLFGFLFFVSACSSDNQTGASSAITSVTEQSTTTSESSSVPSQKTNGPLMSVGEYIEEDNFKITLKKINNEHQSVVLDNLKITLTDVKLLEYTGEGELPNELTSIVDKGDDYPFYTMQLGYKVENTGEERIAILGIESIVTDNGKQYSKFQQGSLIYGGLGTDTINPGAFVESFSIIRLDSEEVNSLTLAFGPTISEEGHEITAYSESIKVNL